MENIYDKQEELENLKPKPKGSRIQDIAEALVNLTTKEIEELRMVQKGNEKANQSVEIKIRTMEEDKNAIRLKINKEKMSSPKFFGQNNKGGKFKNNYKANINTRKNFKNHKI